MNTLGLSNAFFSGGVICFSLGLMRMGPLFDDLEKGKGLKYYFNGGALCLITGTTLEFLSNLRGH